MKIKHYGNVSNTLPREKGKRSETKFLNQEGAQLLLGSTVHTTCIKLMTHNVYNKIGYEE